MTLDIQWWLSRIQNFCDSSENRLKIYQKSPLSKCGCYRIPPHTYIMNISKMELEGGGGGSWGVSRVIFTPPDKKNLKEKKENKGENRGKYAGKTRK